MENGKKHKVAMISGHLDITSEDFNQHYVPYIDKAISLNHDFVIGNARGTDHMALKYLVEQGVSKERIKIYCRKPSLGPLGFSEDDCQIIIKDYKSITERDADMTYNSDYDIAWVRSEDASKLLYGEKYKPRISGTQKNINRRRDKDKNGHLFI